MHIYTHTQKHVQTQDDYGLFDDYNGEYEDEQVDNTPEHDMGIPGQQQQQQQQQQQPEVRCNFCAGAKKRRAPLLTELLGVCSFDRHFAPCAATFLCYYINIQHTHTLMHSAPHPHS